MSNQQDMTSLRPDVLSERDLRHVYVSVVMPAYNEAAGLPKAVSTISDILRDCVKDWEIVIVDDAYVNRFKKDQPKYAGRVISAASIAGS